jgi:hypothetical protein
MTPSFPPSKLVVDGSGPAHLAGHLADNRRLAVGGAERLLLALVRSGLDEKALVRAAALCALLDDPREAS